MKTEQSPAISRRAFLAAGSVATAGLALGPGYAAAQDQARQNPRKVEIISAIPSKDKRSIHIKFKITDPKPDARYNVRAYLESSKTQGPRPIDILYNGVKANLEHGWSFITRGKDGKYFGEVTYNLILAAVTILNDKPYSIQSHVQIRLGVPQEAQKPQAKQKAAKRRIQIIDLRWVDAEKTLAYTIKIISTPPLDKPYNVALYLKPIGVADWKNFGEYTDQNPKNLEFSGVQYLPDLTPYKYAVFIEVTSGDIKIRSETRVFEIKSQPTKKPEEFQVIVVGVNPKQAQYMSQGVRIGTVVDYELEIKGGEPRFEIKTIVINPDNTTRDPRTDSSDSRDFAYWDKPLFPGATKVNIAVKDKTGKTAKTQIVIFAK